MTISREETPFGLGTTGASDPRVPGIPTFSANASGSITIAFGANGNDAVVTYALRCMHDTGGGYALKGYVQANGTLAGSEIFQTLAVWGATVTVTGLTNFIPLTFAAKAKNELAVESAYSSESAVMAPLPDLDWGPVSANLTREVTGGNTIVDEDHGLVISATPTTGGIVPAAEASQATLPEYYGDVTVTYKLKNDSATASRIIVEFSEDNSTWAAATMGTGGNGLTALTTSAAGVSHTYIWDSYADAGKSELDTTVYLRITPYDASPTGGDAAAAVSSAAFVVNNRPAAITWTNADGYTFNKDTTPTFRAVIPYLRGGTYGFPEISIYRTTGMVLVATYSSAESIAGWEYETAPATWVALTVTGIPTAEIDGVNRMRYTPTALSADEYTVNGRMAELRAEG